jgi:hypothetical protein
MNDDNNRIWKEKDNTRIEIDADTLMIVLRELGLTEKEISQITSSEITFTIHKPRFEIKRLFSLKHTKNHEGKS